MVMRLIRDYPLLTRMDEAHDRFGNALAAGVLVATVRGN